MKMKIIKNIMLLILLVLFALNSNTSAQQVTGLSGWSIYLDPGHSQNENIGIYGYSEAKKNLQVGLILQQMLTDLTDIDTAYICRTNDQQSVDLSQRTTQANTFGASWYHSIHGNASSNPSTNNTLLLWGQYQNNLEKVPNGGKAMSDLMIPLLTAGMRIPTIGSYGDHTFYGTCPSTRPCPYLYINYFTSMPSELSEAGFHTNPTQNQLNMNANWKRLEAKTMFWTILKYHNIQRPYVGTAAGIIKDLESGLAINGAIVSLNGQVDTTDTWESLFHLYSSDPNLLRNGFYYFEGIPAGTYQLQVSAEGYDLYTADITMVDTFFTFKDVDLISNVPPTIASTVPTQNDSLYPGVENVVINFTRQMNKTSVEANLTITPTAAYTTAWSNSDKTLTINTTNFAFSSQYDITIGGSAEGKYGHPFDGDGNGVGGDAFTLTVETKVADVTAPTVADVYPSANATNVEYKPVINVAFDELLKTSTISSRFKVVRNSTQTNAAGILRHYIVNGKSVLNFFITTPLFGNESYTILIQDSLQDIFGNPTLVDYTYDFTTGNSNYFAQSIINNFENGITNWLQPGTSGSTVGINPLNTNISSNTTVLNANTGSTKSMQLNYEWDTTAGSWLIREHYSLASPVFQSNTILQVFMFGDGSNNKFRFAIKETSSSTFEVSPWYNMDWSGWKLISWDLSLGQTGNWIGNNILEPPFVFDSFQLTYEIGNQIAATVYFDDLRTAVFAPTSVEEETDMDLPTEFTLQQNFPNPFNPNTQIKFSVPQASNVKLIVTDILGKEVATLVNDNLTAGNYSANFEAGSISSGVYFYTLITDNFKQSRKMILMK
jgi:N-acetylmuramoyl-L-alanine amidase